MFDDMGGMVLLKVPITGGGRYGPIMKGLCGFEWQTSIVFESLDVD